MTVNSEDDIATALINCADEPVHIPGRIQPFGAMLICDSENLAITDASANIERFLDLNVSQVLTQTIDDVLGSAVADTPSTVNRFLCAENLSEPR
jgi:chemotaxis family two-component system sensor kinase Cph1